MINIYLLLELDVSQSPPKALGVRSYTEPDPTSVGRPIRRFEVARGSGEDYLSAAKDLGARIQLMGNYYKWTYPLMDPQLREDLGLQDPSPPVKPSP